MCVPQKRERAWHRHHISLIEHNAFMGWLFPYLNSIGGWHSQVEALILKVIFQALDQIQAMKCIVFSWSAGSGFSSRV